MSKRPAETMQDQRPTKKLKTITPTDFLSLPIELRQINLYTAFADDLVSQTTYGDFLRARRQYHNFIYSYERQCCVGSTVETWIRDVKKSHGQVAKDMEYVERK